jgi:ubiquinone biosynthesis protein COQ9
MILDSPQTKEKILAEFLPIAAFEGWNKDALLKAMKNCGIEENFSELIFENGVLDLAEFYIQSQNEVAAKLILAEENFHHKKIRDKIRFALYARFEVEKENKIALQRLINFYFDLKNFASFEIGSKPMFHSLKACYEIADSIWKSINDQSTDFNFYTKRLTLGKIILRSLLVFLKDDSKNLDQTKNFIDSQIEKVMKFEKRKAQIKKFSSAFFLNESGKIKSPKEIIKTLPFIRLMK